MSEQSNLKVIGQADEAANSRINEIRSAQQAELLKLGQQALSIRNARKELEAHEARITEAEGESDKVIDSIMSLQKEARGILDSIGGTLEGVEGQWFLRSDGAIVQITEGEPAAEEAPEAEG